jgi:hypothetical protein
MGFSKRRQGRLRLQGGSGYGNNAGKAATAGAIGSVADPGAEVHDLPEIARKPRSGRASGSFGFSRLRRQGLRNQAKMATVEMATVAGANIEI